MTARLEKPNIGAIALATLSACNVGAIAREIPRAMPAAPVVSKREDDGGHVAIAHGPELHEPALAPVLPANDMPARGMTDLIAQEVPWNGRQALLATLAQNQGAAAVIDAIQRSAGQNALPPAAQFLL
jgi:hypothetical protein